MAVHHLDNGNKTFGVRNSIELGVWGSAHFYAMHLAGGDTAQLDIRVKGYDAKFNRDQLIAIAEHLLELAESMPNAEALR